MALAVPVSAGATTLTNPAPVPFPEDQGPSSNYPSAIGAQGLPGTVKKVTVTINALRHNNAEDVDVVLVGPGGQVTKLMSDTCAIGTFTGATFTFDDAAPAELGPAACAAEGTFRPSDPFAGSDNIPAPGPGSGEHPKSLSTYNGTNPNGNWNLFAFEDAGAFPDSSNTIAGGWTLQLDLNARCAGQPVTDAGTAAADNIKGTGGIDVIAGLGGNDTISGLGGNDVVCGGPGNDRLLGGGGKDRLNGEAGKDRLIGGGGPDICKGGPKKDTAKSCAKVKSI
jgi:hypothetical protein